MNQQLLLCNLYAFRLLNFHIFGELMHELPIINIDSSTSLSINSLLYRERLMFSWILYSVEAERCRSCQSLVGTIQTCVLALEQSWSNICIVHVWIIILKQTLVLSVFCSVGVHLNGSCYDVNFYTMPNLLTALGVLVLLLVTRVCVRQ